MSLAGWKVEARRRETLLAGALGGRTEALCELAKTEDSPAEEWRVWPALAIRAAASGSMEPEKEPFARWRRALRASAARVLLFEETLSSLARSLDREGVRWVPIKGLDLSTRVYEYPEERPSRDLDLLVRNEDLQAARGVLERAGWESLWTDPRSERYLAEEGYCWQAQSKDGVLLELHHRLWRLVPERLGSELVESAIEEQGLLGRRLELAHAFVLAAVHQWLGVEPRELIGWWDLERISSHAPAGFVEEVVDWTRRWDLQLPVGLAAAYAGTLWSDSKLGSIAEPLWEDLRFSERRVASAGGPTSSLPLSKLFVARLLAGRRSRSGWKALYRRFWAHHGVVAQETPAQWPWLARRLVHSLRGVGLQQAAERTSKYLDRHYPSVK